MFDSKHNQHHRPGPRRRRVARPVPPPRPEIAETDEPLDRLAYRPTEAAKVIGVSLSTLERMIRDGKIPSIKPTKGTRLISVKAIEQWLEEMEATAA